MLTAKVTDLLSRIARGHDVNPRPGLVDMKVCAVDVIWSGLKLTIRKELR